MSWILFFDTVESWCLSSSLSFALGWLSVVLSSPLWGVGAIPRRVIRFIFTIVYFVGSLNEFV